MEYLTTERDLQSRYTWEDLQMIKYRTDDTLGETFTHWHMVVSSASFDMTEKTNIQSFLTLFRTSPKLAHDIQTFDRMRDDHPDKCLKFLTDAVERVVSFDRLEQNRLAKIKQLSGGLKSAHVTSGDGANQRAAPSQEKGGGKGKGKGKGKHFKSGGPGKRSGSGDDKPTEPGGNTTQNTSFCRKFVMNQCTLTAEECLKKNGRVPTILANISRKCSASTLSGPSPIREPTPNHLLNPRSNERKRGWKKVAERESQRPRPPPRQPSPTLPPPREARPRGPDLRRA